MRPAPRMGDSNEHAKSHHLHGKRRFAMTSYGSRSLTIFPAHHQLGAATASISGTIALAWEADKAKGVAGVRRYGTPSPLAALAASPPGGEAGRGADG